MEGLLRSSPPCSCKHCVRATGAWLRVPAPGEMSLLPALLPGFESLTEALQSVGWMNVDEEEDEDEEE